MTCATDGDAALAARLKRPFGSADSTDVLPAPDGRRRSDGESGFTLVELLVAMSISSIVATMAVMGLRAYEHSQELSGTAHKLVSAMRNVAERAQSEGRTYCVQIAADGKSWNTWRYSCQSGFTSNGNPAAQVVQNDRVQGANVVLANATGFVAPGASTTTAGMCPAASLACLYFYPRGSASAGSLQVTDGSHVFTANVEGLTGRVYLG